MHKMKVILKIIYIFFKYFSAMLGSRVGLLLVIKNQPGVEDEIDRYIDKY